MNEVTINKKEATWSIIVTDCTLEMGNCELPSFIYQHMIADQI